MVQKKRTLGDLGFILFSDMNIRPLSSLSGGRRANHRNFLEINFRLPYSFSHTPHPALNLSASLLSSGRSAPGYTAAHSCWRRRLQLPGSVYLGTCFPLFHFKKIANICSSLVIHHRYHPNEGCRGKHMCSVHSFKEKRKSLAYRI